jgi:hypothetical protein
VVNITIY